MEHERGQWNHDGDDDFSVKQASLTHATPCWPRAFRPKEAEPFNGPFIYDPFVDEHDSLTYSNSNDADKERADEIARLKGVLWPGMDIFDSATEQMKRKRNQKKDLSILKMMEKTSMGVEPTEFVFSPTGVLRKQRVISGNVEDSSPLKGETPIPKKRANRPKRVLSQMDPNAQRGADGKRAKKNVKRDRDTFGETGIQQSLYTPSRATAQAFGRLGGQISIGDDMEEFALALRGHDFRQHNKLAVFRDMPGSPERKPEFEPSFVPDEPAASQPFFLRREVGVSDGDSHSPLPAGHHSNLLENEAHDLTEKENVEPMLNIYGRVDPLVGWHSPVMKRAERGLSPQYLFGDAPYAGYSPFECHESPTGYSLNPLAGSLAKMGTEENPIYAADNVLRGHAAPRASSPDATISDVEDEDFDRLYTDGGV